MPNNTFPIDSVNLPWVRAYILEQFAQRSWWPGEGPLQARAALEALDNSPESLQQWCLDWLDSGQWRQLRAAWERSVARSAEVSPRSVL